jgi:CRISPR-associated endonuclease Cas3-HD
MARSLSDFTARPGQDLREHTEGVVACGRALVADAGTNAYGDEWAEIIETIAWVHDIGKLTEYFQTYIRTGDRSSAYSPKLTRHSTFGGLVAAAALRTRGFEPETVASGFYSVAKHHSVLQDIPTDAYGYYNLKRPDASRRYERAQKQLDSIDETAARAADEMISEASNGAFRWEELVERGIEQVAPLIESVGPTGDDEAFYGTVLRTWSTLAASDKMDASGLTSSTDLSDLNASEDLPLQKLNDHIRALSQTPIGDDGTASEYLDDPMRGLPHDSASLDSRVAGLRTAANARATRQIQELHAEGKRIFEVTLPTGFGKTLTSLRAGLSLSQKRNSRVIYALPYTSIIDQTDEVVRDIFGVEPTDPRYTKHHHLADTRSLHQDDSPNTGRDVVHAEGWRSELTLTTFTQLLESLAGPRNTQSIKLPSLQDAVILIDEPQAISLDWWGLLGRLATYLKDEYDATIVFITATQPRILEFLDYAPTPTSLLDLQSDCVELLADNPRVEFNLHRSLTNHLSGNGTPPLSLSNAANMLRSETAGSRNVLAIVNTVGSVGALTTELGDEYLPLAADLLEYLRHVDQNGDEFDPFEYLEYLSTQHPSADRLVASLTTRLRPVDRSALLECLNRIVDPHTKTPFDDIPTLTVSTQLIEAGVDVSFDRLFRDFAPLPALVQAAGRCNRDVGGSVSRVTVWRLDSMEDDSYIPSELIYGDGSLLTPTRSVLRELREKYGECIPEAPFISSSVSNYYRRLHSAMQTANRADPLVKAFDSANGEKLRRASLVAQDYETQDVFVAVTNSEEEDIEAYVSYRDSEHWNDARRAFDRLKPTLVSVPSDGVADTDVPVIHRVSSSETMGTYDIDTGLGFFLDQGKFDVEI